MIFVDQWKALSGRIHGLARAGRLHAQFSAIKNYDTYGRAMELRAHGQRILTALEEFRNSYDRALPSAAITVIDDCISKDLNGSVGQLLGGEQVTPDSREEAVWAAIVKLASFEAEMTFILSDVQGAIRARAELAFEHLQRLTVVDVATREHWKDALDENEIACERRGAVHLLQHGIFAFKVDGIGERTDLVFPKPIDGRDAQRYADGFVLTEWKVARSNEEAKKKFAEALRQAQRYARGVLAGVELTSVRYLVVVSLQRVDVRNDIRDDKGIVFRHINIALDLEPPSKASRSAVRGANS